MAAFPSFGTAPGDGRGSVAARVLVAVVAIAAAVAAAIALGLRLAAVLPPAYVVLVFLVAVLAVAALLGLGAGIGAAFAASLAYNFFFVEPTWTFAVADPREVFALGVFLVAAILTGGLAGRLREVADAARRRADTLAMLHDFAERVSATGNVDVIRSLVVRRVAERIHGTALLIDPDDLRAGTSEAWPAPPDLTPEERRAVARVFETGRTAEAAAPGYSERRFEFRPLVTVHGVVAVVGLAPSSGTRLVAADDEQGLAALLDHAATALERARFATESAAAEAAAEKERLRSALLSSISHDLRTPLATILGSVTSLRQLGDRMEPSDRGDLLAAIEEETDRLSRFVADLLAMTRLEAGLDLRRDWVDVGDVARAAAAHIGLVHPTHPVEPRIAAGLPLVRSDAVLLEQVLFNLLDNAAKASPAGSAIVLTAAAEPDVLMLTILDRGIGLRPEDLERLFGRRGADTAAPGGHGGLGLAIARRVVAAMGGTMTAVSPAVDGTGTAVTLRLPVEAISIPAETEQSEP